ncbi:MAG: hypothetical protein PHO26_02190 [Dehalococcoidia bacterium]|nr:hypothetical protein [Dehalococcoidia bacterium]MDD5494585.1 hypothetical protein [Dehalococcoidia bacterium]
MSTRSEEEAKKTPYELYIAPRPFSFELDSEMLVLLRKDCDPPLIVEKFAAEISGKKQDDVDTIAKKVFGKYGEDWMRRTLKLGEEYPDRTYEILKEAVDKTGEMKFPLVLQRFIEIAYLGTQQFRILPIVENWAKRLVYRVKDCYIYKLEVEKCGQEVAGSLPCRYACLAACKTALDGLGLDAAVEMEATMVKDGACQFALNRI